MKNIISLIFFCLISTPLAIAIDFDDVGSAHKNFAAINYLFDRGIVAGYPDGSFKPEDTINRVEALKMVTLAADYNENELAEIDFPDVNTDDWYYDYVANGVFKNIVEGYPDGKFRPDNNINVAESLKIVLMAFRTNDLSEPDNDPFIDVTKDEWYAKYAFYAKEKNLIEPYGNGTLNAGRDISRGDFAELLYRLVFTKDNDLDVFPLSQNWPKIQNGAQEYEIKYPSEWNFISANDQSIFWKQDSENDQLSWIRLYPESSTVVVAVDDNEENYSLDQYISRLNYAGDPEIDKRQLNNLPFASIHIPGSLVTDYYFEMPDRDILVIYSQIGDGDNKEFLSEQIRYLVGSVRPYDGPSNFDVTTTTDSSSMSRDELLSEVRKLILVENSGENALNMFSDLLIIETDSIGIGTGPIDYYYSDEFDVTLKYERDTKTLLALSESKSTAF
ncbi:hypothetical protein GF340_02485 [Candidatus Peregrinibacteria bacterium]|nr:hypothetical protein [Candidatus Peregrinibacteria bacterium]